MSRMRERWRQIDRRLVDRLIALGMSLLVVVFVLVYEDVEGSRAVNLLVALVVTLSLLARRDHPLFTAVLAAAGTFALQLWLTTPLAFPPATISLVIVSYSLGTHADGWAAIGGLAITAGTILAVSILQTPEDILFPFFVFGIAPWIVARVLRSQTRLARELAEKEARVRHLREQEGERAIARERTRVARELHDVLAHNLSVMVIQASGARRALITDPDSAIAAARLIERTGREALGELRQIFGPLRRGEGEALQGSLSLAQVEGLVERARSAGLPVTLRVDGSPVQLSAGAEAAAYRLIQEALTNVLKHAPGASTEVHLGFRPDGAWIQVANDGDVAPGRPRSIEGSGQGLIGMRERIELYGGEFEAGPREDGGFEVKARLPVEAAAVAA